MRGEDKPYDMQAPCNDTEFTKAIENDRKIEETSSSSLFTSPPTFELPNLRTTIASATSVSATTTSTLNNELASIMATTSKSLNLPIPDSPIVSFPNICSFLNGDDIDQKVQDQISEPNTINKPLKFQQNLGGKLPQTISLPTSPLPLSTAKITLPTQPVNLYTAKLPIPSPKIFPPLPNSATPLFFAVDLNSDQRCIQTSRETARGYVPFQSNASTVMSNNQLACSISVGSVDSSTMSLSPCPSSSGSSSSPHSSSGQGINGPTTSFDVGLPSAESISISPAALHLTSSLISTHLPHSLDSLLTPAASPEDDSLEPWIQTV